MAVTQIDPDTALILIDLQKGIAALPLAHPVAEISARAGALADAFRRHGLPTVLVTVAGGAPGRTEQGRRMGDLPSDWTELLPVLGHQPSDHRVTKRTWGAFTATGLEAHLREKGVTQVVLAGIATSIGVESSARQAYAAGFNVTLAVDAMTDPVLEAHLNSTNRIFPRLGETGTTREIIARLDQVRA